jgi:putative SOS response-associated peptidase YedK
MKRYVLETDKEIIEEIFDVKANSESLFDPNYNAGKGHTMPIIMKGESGREVRSSVWGLKTEGAKNEIVEVRHEDILEDDGLKKLIDTNPCIVLASGFYKWKETVEDPLPFYLRVLSQEVVGIAGFYSSYKNDEGREVHTFAVLTMPANPLVEPLDDRMPVIILPKDYDQWLTDGASDMVKVGFNGNDLLPDMAVVRVPELVNDPSNNSKELIQPIPKLRNYEGSDED